MALHYNFHFIETLDVDKDVYKGSALEGGYREDNGRQPNWSPLWMPQHMQNFHKLKSSVDPFFLFHLDRTIKE